MRISTRRIGLVGSGVALAMLHSTAGAPPLLWTITYVPVSSTSIPTMSQWGLLALVVLMTVAAYLRLRNKVGGATAASVAASLLLSSWALSGHLPIGSAHALPSCGTGLMCTPGGGVATATGLGPLPFQNTSGVTLRITGISPFPSAPTTSPTCAVGLLMPPGSSCYVLVVPG